MKKIMFNDAFGLTKSVLAGKKKMVRGLISEMVRQSPFATTKWEYVHSGKEFKPKYKIGEIVAVAQSMHDVCKESDPEFKTLGYLSHCFGKAWTNKMLVEANRMPHQIKITNIRMELLQDISEEDCIREGIHKGKVGNENHWMDAYYTHKSSIEPHCKPREAFADLIDKLNGEGTWESNPQVCVFEFELIK